MMYYHIYLYHGRKYNYYCVITQTLQNGQTLGQFFELLYVISWWGNRLGSAPILVDDDMDVVRVAGRGLPRLSRWPAFCWVWEVVCMLSVWRRLISICTRGAISSGANWATPKLKPTEFKVDVEFSPPRVIRVPCDFQAICIEPVA